MKINKQAPQINAGQVGPIQQTQPLPSVSQTGGDQHSNAQFEQGGSLASQLVPTPNMNQSAPSKGLSLLSLQIGQTGQTDQIGQVEVPANKPALTDFQDAAHSMMHQIKEIQGRVTEELRTEDAITGVTVGKSDGGYHLNVIMDSNNPTFTPPQVQAAGENLLAELGFVGMDVKVIAPAVNPFPAPGNKPTLSDFQDAATSMMSQIEEIQGRMTEELRTEDAITGVTVGKSDGGYHLNVLMGNNPTFTPPQVQAAGENLLKELGFENMDVKVVAPEVNPFPGGNNTGLPTVPANLLPGITAAANDFLYSGEANAAGTLDEKPNVEGLDHYLLRDKMPVDGSREEVFVDKSNDTFYMSSTILSRMGPEFSGTSWSGPHKLN